MSDKSGIEWTDATWNPIRGTVGRHHCVRISEGCKHCYAAAMNHRFGGPDYVKGADTPRLDQSALLEPLKWRKPRRIFVCSMTDLFMDEHSDEMLDRVFAVMCKAHNHTFQVLTKRPARMREYVSRFFGPRLGRARGRIYEVAQTMEGGPEALEAPGWPFPNVWLGVSCENQQRAAERIPDLLATPAAVRFVSAEPLLGPLSLSFLRENWCHTFKGEAFPWLCGGFRSEPCPGSPRLDWVIVGGESGPGARPCDVSWIRAIADQCQSAGVPVFVKQLGAYPIDSSPNYFDDELTDSKGGDMSEWPEDLRIRQLPETASA